MFNPMTRRSLHLTLAATAMVVWACADPNGEDLSGSSSGGSAETSEGETPATAGGSSDGAEVTAQDVLVSLADNVFAPTHVAFSEAADTFSSAAATHAAAVADGGDVQTSREAVEVAFVELAAALQHVELLQIGPGAGSAGIEGEFLRDELYSWPAVNTCRIDQELVAGEYGAPDFIDTRLVNVYGFDALEYLLFAPTSDNTCPPQLPINGSGEWAALGEAELEVRRTAYAAVVASAMATVADDLESTWAEGGTWHGYLSDPNSGPLGSTSAAMDEVLRAIFYIDKSLKDIKLARPAGLKDCSADVCLEDVESPWAGVSKENAVANLAAFRELFWAGPSGDEGVGFDDWLTAVGEGALGDEMLADTDAAIEALEAIDGSFVEALTADADALDVSHAAVVELTDDLKGDFPVVLMLNIPTEAAGDAD